MMAHSPLYWIPMISFDMQKSMHERKKKTMIAFGLIIAFLLVYFIIYSRQVKRKREDTPNSVEQFHNNYSKRFQGNQEDLRNPQPKRDTYTKYVTKYNSTEDYREK